MTERCGNCDRDSTALTTARFDHPGGHTTHHTLCSGCIGAVETTLLQRRLDTYRAPALGSYR